MKAVREGGRTTASATPGIHKKTGGDAYVTSANPTLNTGGYGTLEVGITPGAGIRYSYLQFDFSSLAGNSNINYALLYLNQIGYSSTPPYAYTKVAIRRVTSPWSESTITWNNQPNYTDTHTSSSNTLNATGYDFYPPWEVSQIIKDSIAYNQPYGFIVQGFENYSGGTVTFTSRDSLPELAPYIYVDMGDKKVADIVVTHHAIERWISRVNEEEATPRGICEFLWKKLKEKKITRYFANQDDVYLIDGDLVLVAEFSVLSGETDIAGNSLHKMVIVTFLGKMSDCIELRNLRACYSWLRHSRRLA